MDTHNLNCCCKGSYINLIRTYYIAEAAVYNLLIPECWFVIYLTMLYQVQKHRGDEGWFTQDQLKRRKKKVPLYHLEQLNKTMKVMKERRISGRYRISFLPNTFRHVYYCAICS
jgi:hypothetical protein